jgi:folylpolyglutamate synthase/dihydropteroate synthase
VEGRSDNSHGWYLHSAFVRPPIDQLPTGTSLSMFEMGTIALFVLFSSSDADDN